MTRRQRFMEKMENSAVMFSADVGSNLNSVISLQVVNLSDNTNSSNANENYNFNTQFNPFAIIIVGLFSFVFGVGFFTFFICRRTHNWDGSTTFRRADANNTNNGEAAQGLERSVIESFPVFSYNLVKGLKLQAKGSECAVCLTDFEDDEMLRLLPKCSHAFKTECNEKWLLTHTACPVCRTSLRSAGDSNATSNDFGVVEPQATSEHLTIVADNGGGVGRQGSTCRDISNDETTSGAVGYDSMGHSLRMVQTELEQGTEWYIVTANCLTPGLHRSCSFAGKHQPSSSVAPPAYSKPCNSVNDEERRSRSERWGSISMNPALFLRTFSVRVTAGDSDDVEAEQEGGKPYFKRSLSWLKGRDRQGGLVSSRYADQSAA